MVVPLAIFSCTVARGITGTTNGRTCLGGEYGVATRQNIDFLGVFASFATQYFAKDILRHPMCHPHGSGENIEEIGIRTAVACIVGGIRATRVYPALYTNGLKRPFPCAITIARAAA